MPLCFRCYAWGYYFMEYWMVLKYFSGLLTCGDFKAGSLAISSAVSVLIPYLISDSDQQIETPINKWYSINKYWISSRLDITWQIYVTVCYNLLIHLKI